VEVLGLNAVAGLCEGQKVGVEVVVDYFAGEESFCEDHSVAQTLECERHVGGVKWMCVD